jgi:hypothetical protein
MFQGQCTCICTQDPRHMQGACPSAAEGVCSHHSQSACQSGRPSGGLSVSISCKGGGIRASMLALVWCPRSPSTLFCLPTWPQPFGPGWACWLFWFVAAHAPNCLTCCTLSTPLPQHSVHVAPTPPSTLPYQHSPTPQQHFSTPLTPLSPCVLHCPHPPGL